MIKRGRFRSAKEVEKFFEIAMRAVYKKLREEKIMFGRPLIMGDEDGNIFHVDPKTMKIIKKI